MSSLAQLPLPAAWVFAFHYLTTCYDIKCFLLRASLISKQTRTTMMMRFQRKSRSLFLSSVFWPTTRSYHHLLPDTRGDTILTGRDLLARLASRSICRIAFIRHGQTSPASDGIDFNRPLSEIGISQARKAGATYGRLDLPPYFSLALSSPAPRTMDTTRNFLESTSFGDQVVEIMPINVAYDGTMQPEGSKLFSKIGYAPLRDYLESPNEEDRTASQHLLGKYAIDVVDSIVQALGETSKVKEPSTLLFVGHSVYLPSAALKVASLAGFQASDVECLLDLPTREAEGYLLELDQRTCRYLSRGG